AGFLSKGIKISSSKDPYGIRRDANAVIKIIIDFNLDFDFNGLIKAACEKFTPTDITHEELEQKVNKLFYARLEGVFKDFFSIRYDVVKSVLNASVLNINDLYLRCHSVARIVSSESITHLTALHKRLKNIIKKSEPFNVSETLLQENEEKLLFDIFKETKIKIEGSLAEANYLQACSQFLEMKPVIDNFFDKVLVMAEDKDVKRNRIALLQKMDELLMKIADFSLIVDTK
ncbi:MAG: glycine--tRNA ligase subunit beta, partial [bacterium]|nr:glycine--tRNA ligase subunit beta [bacterium]